MLSSADILSVSTHLYRLADRGIKLGWAVAVRVPFKIYSWIAIAIVAGVGLGLMAARVIIIQTVAPLVMKHTRMFVDSAKALIVVLEVMRIESIIIGSATPVLARF